MTKVIFESETLIGKCDYDSLEANGFRYAEPDYAEIWARTVGTISQGLLKIEQHCYVRQPVEMSCPLQLPHFAPPWRRWRWGMCRLATQQQQRCRDRNGDHWRKSMEESGH